MTNLNKKKHNASKLLSNMRKLLEMMVKMYLIKLIFN
jgi:hypothetical protein